MIIPAAALPAMLIEPLMKYVPAGMDRVPPPAAIRAVTAALRAGELVPPVVSPLVNCNNSVVSDWLVVSLPGCPGPCCTRWHLEVAYRAIGILGDGIRRLCGVLLTPVVVQVVIVSVRGSVHDAVDFAVLVVDRPGLARVVLKARVVFLALYVLGKHVWCRHCLQTLSIWKRNENSDR